MKKNPRFLSSTLVALCFLVLQKTQGMELKEHIYNDKITYSSGRFDRHQEGTTFSTLPTRAQEKHEQKAFKYEKAPQQLKQEKILMKISLGKDGRKRILETTKWPYNICTQISMTFNGQEYGGSGCLVGPHHVLTCGHNVYDDKEKTWAEKILVYPALNGKSAPFGEVQVVKAITFKGWITEGNSILDMALLILSKSIGKYTGWGGLLSVSKDEEAKLLQEKVYITGYPGDKGFKQMWSMNHKIKLVKAEEFEYEIDTYGGQSGSPIWINKSDGPMILGVHTRGDDSINSGVRLSTKKFTDFLDIISKTYVLNSSTVPTITTGYEEAYRKFLKGVLIYRPQEGSEIGRIDMPIAALKNPLEGTFDLSRCKDIGKHFSISTGYRKSIKAEDKEKVGIWLVPRFLIQRELETTASHFKEIEGKWALDAEVGIFWTLSCQGITSVYDYSTSENMKNLSKGSLYEVYGGRETSKEGQLFLVYGSISWSVGTHGEEAIKKISLVFSDLK